MTGQRDPYRLPVSPSDGRALAACLHGAPPASAGWALPGEAELASLQWARVDALSAFWHERGPMSLVAAVTDLCAGVALLGGDLLVLCRRVQGRQGLWLGSATAPPVELLAGALPGVEAAAVRGGHVPLTLPRAATALVGVPGAQRPGRSSAITERMLSSTLDSFGLWVWMAAADREQIVAAHGEALAVAGALQGDGSHQVQVTPTTSRTIHDPAASVLARLVEQEADRLLEMQSTGGLLVQAYLSADVVEDLPRVEAIVLPATTTTAPMPRPMRPVRLTRDGLRHVTLLRPREVAGLVQPPEHDVPSLLVRPWARFDSHPDATPARPGRPSVRLGLNHEGVALTMAVDRLAAHTLVTGMTGTGKTSFLLALLDQLPADVPWLVIEPSKDDLATTLETEATVYRIGAQADPARPSLQINPLEAFGSIPIRTHADRVVALLCSSFELWDPLPRILEQALVRAYERHGWDLGAGRNPMRESDPGHPAFPALSELVAHAIDVINEVGYAAEVRDNSIGAIRSRIGSLTTGTKGAMFDTDRTSNFERELLHGNVVLNLDALGSAAEKAFAAGVVINAMGEVRRGIRSRQLGHVLVLEEAHQLLRKSPSSDSFANQLVGDLLAEARSAGQGVILLDQSPAGLVDQALSNTVTKIALRTQGSADQEAISTALGLTPEQRQVLLSLPDGAGLVFTEGMDRPHRVRLVGRAPRAQPVSGTGPVHVGPDRPFAAVAAKDPAVRRLATTWVLARPQRRAQVREVVLATIRRVVPAEHEPGTIEAAARMAVTNSIEDLGRARLLSHELRAALAATVLGDDPAGPEPLDVFRSGTQPYELCPAACPGGGCRTGEAIRPRSEVARARLVSAARRAGRGTPEDLAAELAPRLRHEAVCELGTEVDVDLVRTATRCLAVQALGPALDPLDLVDAIGRLPVAAEMDS